MREPYYENDWCRMCSLFCSEWCYNYHNPEDCEDWRLAKFPIILLKDSKEMIEHIHRMHRRIINILLKKGDV
jgi:hypothetical protein